MRFLHFTVTLFTISCGGIAVFDDGGGGSASTTSGPGASTGGTKTTGTANGTTRGVSASATTGGSLCDQLEVVRARTFEEATRCDACLDFDPCGQAFVTDKCGCVMPATSQSLATLSEQAYRTWVDAGCGPWDCNLPCQVGGFSSCMPQGSGCQGTCAFP